MTLQLSPFEKALHSLEKAYQAKESDCDNEFLLDACIQRFEYTYELAHKMLKRHLEMTEPSGTTIDEMSFPQLIRTGFERGLLQSSWDIWQTFRAARNITSHTYDEQKAQQVYEILLSFINEAQYLLTKLQINN